MKVIPAIDLLNGACVRLRQGDYGQVTPYPEPAVSIAINYAKAGFTRLHLVDLDGARAGKVVNWDVVEQVVRQTGMAVDFGGGIKTREEAVRLLDLGVKQLNIGSLAFRQPAVFKSWVEEFGADRLILSADVRDGNVAISGWAESTGTSLEAAIITYRQMGIRHVTCTDISKDGMMAGPATELYQAMTTRFPDIEWTASGGVSGITNLMELRRAGCHAAIAGKALLEGRLDIGELAENGYL